jgi:hypothetical protein
MKTIDKVCLRCDWEGETRDPACPRCATPLWVPRPTDEPRAGRGPLAWFQERRRARGAEREEATVSRAPAPAPERVPDEPPDRPVAPGRAERRRAWIPVALVVVLALVVIGVVRAGAPPEPIDPWAATLGGRVLYAAPDQEDAGWYRLWVWDVTSGVATMGPRLREPLSLVPIVAHGWVGAISSNGAGESADMLRFLGPTDGAVSVLTGAKAVWDPDGVEAFSVTKPASCSRFDVMHFDPTTFDILPIGQDARCGEVVGLAATQGAAYLTLLDGGVSSIRSASSAGDELLARGVVGVAASGNDLITVRPAEPRTVSVLSLSPGPDEGLRLVGDPDDPLVVESVLAGDRYGIGTLVLGTYGGRRGIFSIPGNELEELEPELISATAAQNVHATIARDGSVILTMDGAFFLVRGGGGGSRLDLELPEGGPVPAGPLLWIEGSGDG